MEETNDIVKKSTRTKKKYITEDVKVVSYNKDMKIICIYILDCGISLKCEDDFVGEFIKVKYYGIPSDKDFEIEWIK